MYSNCAALFRPARELQRGISNMFKMYYCSGNPMREKLFKVKKVTVSPKEDNSLLEKCAINGRLELIICSLRQLFNYICKKRDEEKKEESKKAIVKVSVVGVGSVGMASAFTVLAQGVCNNLALLDTVENKLMGEMLDLQHGSNFLRNVKVHASTDYTVTAGSKIIILAAGVKQREGESRLELVSRNTEVLKEIVPQIVKHSPDAIIIVASNPVDILTYVTWKLSGLPKHRVIGAGTNLDTARFRFLMSERLGIAPTSCYGYIIGEHGDSSVPVWSGVNVAGVRLCELNKDIGTDKDKEDWKALHTMVVNGGYEVVKLKGYTSWAVGLSVSQIAQAIINDAGTVHAVSTYAKGDHDIKQEVFLSLPCVLGNCGVNEIVRQQLSEVERKMLHRSAEVMSKVQSGLKIT